MTFLSFPDIRFTQIQIRGNAREFCDPVRLIGQFSSRFQKFKNFREINETSSRTVIRRSCLENT
ncbi:hypothetical protein DQM68_08320 [Leptospira mayottensis]|uniref:Uncharacterized protein n=2 Tax=Leptospira mayottensis TaxID=1137606 RepID=A0AA87MMH1_9LEPT|nr:hypothetical protein DQM68_08320 [Leptospira mayottensis]AZQ02878.1 hypothetical protein LEP1GSC190_13365 [Leptospira mayottensis 200901116]EKR98377.1 hypothetical protein LEP1GSC125_1888 [Leptospira mayottensis 200901122]AXR64553.1 hypothetical protein DQM28_10280 [Leptospira mayottensis]AXR68275.1 hypothetical protein DPV73_09785 [Leptospira mayottensis]